VQLDRTTDDLLSYPELEAAILATLDNKHAEEAAEADKLRAVTTIKVIAKEFSRRSSTVAGASPARARAQGSGSDAVYKQPSAENSAAVESAITKTAP
jgi:hypothetical protein